MLLLCFGSGEETVGDLDLQQSVSISSSSACREKGKRPRHRCWAPFSEAGCLLQSVDFWLPAWPLHRLILGVVFWPLTQSLPFQSKSDKHNGLLYRHVVAPFDNATHRPLEHSLPFLYPLLAADRSQGYQLVWSRLAYTDALLSEPLGEVWRELGLAEARFGGS